MKMTTILNALRSSIPGSFWFEKEKLFFSGMPIASESEVVALNLYEDGELVAHIKPHKQQLYTNVHLSSFFHAAIEMVHKKGSIMVPFKS